MNYVVCCNLLCQESGNIKKKNKCSSCKSVNKCLNLKLLNVSFCPIGVVCNKTCGKLHPTKKHKSPTYISPCVNGMLCDNEKCLFLHPNNKCNTWIVRYINS
jgi:hypothetical protein